MGSSYGRGRLHLAAAIDQRAESDAEVCVELARLAERGALDFVTVGDAVARPGPDALAVSARVAPETGRVGLVPVVTATPDEPCRVRAAVATLDRVSRGRAGWWLGAPGPEEGTVPVRARHIGSVGAGDAEGAWLPAQQAPAVTRPQQGHPVRIVDATEGESRGAAARCADVALLRVADPDHADAVRTELRDGAAVAGRDPDELRVLVSLRVDLGGGEHAAEPGHGGGGPRRTADGPLYRGGPVALAELIADWHRAGATDGFHLVPVEPRRDLERLVNGTVALLQHRGLFRTFYPGSTLREHLGLGPAQRHVVTGGGG
ncbi:LLM class flavin-dependent oxidoreductase [Streptomyces caniscabiei]|uniref:LLM class flavin-dependent oxidoreductase n=1 Tax=Streptomyces caniscabiei TaxID=2746961 RepID=UPI0029A3E4DE|nr:LLM class flavin-dependent oxidoreductase [Streptomyces caniscabiei]MDX2603213.1 LLM class flavin-dependent oxidoreductase [Streptomyces caniscabiei]MDX2740289.1 LLM class flavin-dependent oxidoreductase [Streptomyces caniscabiei]MDX2778525.1 LLM class flavin-dependent oxidoreductase [Streptomyces caniscabiei]